MAEVYYSFPGETSFHYITAKEQAVDDTKSFFVYASFISNTPIGIPAEEQRLERLPAIQWDSTSLKTSGFVLDKNDYVLKIKDLISVLKKKKLKKVVFSRPKLVPASKRAVHEILSDLRSKYPNAFVYALNSETYGIWLGASPETLLEGSDQRFNTMSLAGTRQIGDDNWLDKEIEEQAFVSEYISQTLQKMKVQKLQTSKTQSVQAGPVQHLRTNFSFEYSGEVLKLIHELSPTPAVCGTPKNEAFDYILQKEAYDRQLYASYIGLIGPGSSKVFVNLRCMQIIKNACVLYVGGGITASSIPEHEWEETELKAKTLLDIL